jgi:hypothetical protein
MRIRLTSWLLGTFLFVPLSVNAQSVDFGIKVGSQRTDAIATSAPYSDVPFRKIVGGVIEVSLPAALAVEISAFKQNPTYLLPPTTVIAPQPNIQSETQRALLMANPAVHTAIEIQKAKVAERAEVDATFVLDKALILLNRCMMKGRGFAPGAAARVLEIIGRHVNINAFAHDEQHVHLYVNGLSDRLNTARLRIVEKPSTPLVIDGEQEMKVG